jgi:Zn-finger nucleic acid-binding protein
MLKCPKCQIPLCGVEYEGVAIQVCPECRGALVGEGDLAQIKEHRRLWWSEAQKDEAVALAVEADTLDRLSCPKCQSVMDKFSVSIEEAGFHVDRCAACRMSWFDSGELDLIRVQYAKAFQRQTSPQEQARLVRVALAEAEFASEASRQTIRDEYKPVLGVWMAAFPAEALAWAASRVAQVAVREFNEAVDGSAGSRRTLAFVLAAVGLAVAIGLALVVYFFGHRLRWFWS